MSATTTSSAASTTLTPIPGSAISRFISDGWVTTWRNLMKIIRVPEILLFSLIQPIMFVLLFTYVFGAAIDIPGEGYTSFLMAGIFAQTVVFGSTYSGAAMAQDLKDGIIDRFRTLPMSGAAVLVGPHQRRPRHQRALDDRDDDHGLHRRMARQLVAARVSRRRRPAAAVRLRVLVGHGVLGHERQEPRDHQQRLVLDPLSAHVHLERLRAEREPARPAAHLRRVEPRFVARAVGARTVRQRAARHPVGDAWTAQNPIATVLIGVVVLLVVFVPLSIRKFATLSR
jgi:ABC-2 type transport system permease protein